MTEDLQQKSISCLSGCFSSSELVTGKLSDSWVTVCHSEPTHRWLKLGQELRRWGPREITQTAGRAVCVGNAELKGCSRRYQQFPRKGTKYQKHETREKGSERQELHPAEWGAGWGVQSQSRELEGQGEWAIDECKGEVWLAQQLSTIPSVTPFPLNCDPSPFQLHRLGRVAVWGSWFAKLRDIEKSTQSRNEKIAII